MALYQVSDYQKLDKFTFLDLQVFNYILAEALSICSDKNNLIKIDRVILNCNDGEKILIVMSKLARLLRYTILLYESWRRANSFSE